MIVQSRDHQSFIATCRYNKRLLDKLLAISRVSKIKVNFNKIKKAIYLAQKYHARQKRGTGQPYYSHPLEVTYIVADYLFRTDIIITSILHDTIEDTLLTKEIIVKEFGNKIANQVEDLTRIKQDQKISSAEIVEILYQQNKKDLLLVKLCDRLHNMQTIGAKSSDKAQKITLETLDTFLPIAAYLEVPDIQKQLNKYCGDIIANHEIF